MNPLDNNPSGSPKDDYEAEHQQLKDLMLNLDLAEYYAREIRDTQAWLDALSQNRDAGKVLGAGLANYDADHRGKMNLFIAFLSLAIVYIFSSGQGAFLIGGIMDGLFILYSFSKMFIDKIRNRSMGARALWQGSVIAVILLLLRKILISDGTDNFMFDGLLAGVIGIIAYGVSLMLFPLLMPMLHRSALFLKNILQPKSDGKSDVDLQIQQLQKYIDDIGSKQNSCLEECRKNDILEAKYKALDTVRQLLSYFEQKRVASIKEALTLFDSSSISIEPEENSGSDGKSDSSSGNNDDSSGGDGLDDQDQDHPGSNDPDQDNQDSNDQDHHDPDDQNQDDQDPNDQDGNHPDDHHPDDNE